MSVRVGEILKTLNTFAPLEYALDFDNVGLLVGDRETECKKVLVALDATGDVIDEAIEKGVNLIVTHHPLIFDKLCAVVEDDTVGKRICKLIRHGISLICMHTNLDAARGGVNDILAHKLGVKNTTVLDVLGVSENVEYGIGRVGEIEKEEEIGTFLNRVIKGLKACGVKYYATDKKIKKVAVGGGSCGGYLKKAHLLGCDALVSADIKHDMYLTAREIGITVIDAGHFATENPVCEEVLKLLCDLYPGIEISIAERNTQAEKYYTGE